MPAPKGNQNSVGNKGGTGRPPKDPVERIQKEVTSQILDFLTLQRKIANGTATKKQIAAYKHLAPYITRVFKVSTPNKSDVKTEQKRPLLIK